MISLFLVLAGVPAEPPPSLVESLAAPASVQDAEPAAEAEDKAPKWTGSVAVGGKYTLGNSETRSASATADAELRRENDRFTLGFLWIYDENANNPLDDWILTDRKTQGSFKYDYFLSEKTYALANASWQNDFQADLDLRQIYGLGIGRQFREDDTLKLGAELGVSYLNEDYGGPGDKEYVAARAAYNIDWFLSSVWNIGQVGEIYPSLEDKDNVYAKLDTRVKAAFGESMFGQLQWLYDWNNTPPPGTERSDHQFLLGIGWKI